MSAVFSVEPGGWLYLKLFSESNEGSIFENAAKAIERCGMRHSGICGRDEILSNIGFSCVTGASAFTLQVSGFVQTDVSDFRIL